VNGGEGSIKGLCGELRRRFFKKWPMVHRAGSVEEMGKKLETARRNKMWRRRNKDLAKRKLRKDIIDEHRLHTQQ